MKYLRAHMMLSICLLFGFTSAGKACDEIIESYTVRRMLPSLSLLYELKRVRTENEAGLFELWQLYYRGDFDKIMQNVSVNLHNLRITATDLNGVCWIFSIQSSFAIQPATSISATTAMSH
ncbi:hypothetical protein CI610_02231 [invertebrate metagenome]|uniref:Uncharacterized protein n=1 Tax=invertebrate metagenome TaxID=1711999 RepID=A0A2H9T6I8_9ZZZZ